MFSVSVHGIGATNWTKNIIIQFSSSVDLQALMEVSKISPVMKGSEIKDKNNRLKVLDSIIPQNSQGLPTQPT